MIDRVLVPLDGSDLAEGVLPYVKHLAKRLNARITFVQVIESGMAEAAMEMASAATIESLARQAESDAKAANDYLSRLVDGWRTEGIDAGWQVAQVEHLPRGTPAVAIIELAHSLRADLIAMSTHGRSGLGRLLFGSVADQVLREAGTPVLLVRAGHEPAKTSSAPRS